MEIFKNIATVVGCISACMALLIAIIKPLRQWVANSCVRKSQYKQLFEKMNEINGKMDKSIKQNEKLETRLTRVEQNVLANEADRLRSELFDCGNRCRRGIRLHPEEMEHIRAVFTKYSIVLKQNGTGENEYNFICDYYNHQKFPEYHQHN
jgi:hypothetical protein